MRQLLAALAGLSLAAAAAQADQYKATIHGTVEWNVLPAGPLANTIVHAGDDVTVVMMLDTSSYRDDANWPVRGYIIDPATFAITLNKVTIGMKSPLSANQLPMLVVRDNDPAVDGFYSTTSDTEHNLSIPTNGQGRFPTRDFVEFVFEATYPQERLATYDLPDTVGTYDYTGLQVFDMALMEFGQYVIYIDYTYMTIEAVVPAPACKPNVVTGTGCLGPTDLLSYIGLYFTNFDSLGSAVPGNDQTLPQLNPTSPVYAVPCTAAQQSATPPVVTAAGLKADYDGDCQVTPSDLLAFLGDYFNPAAECFGNCALAASAPQQLPGGAASTQAMSDSPSQTIGSKR